MSEQAFTPLATWEDEYSSHEDLVWWSRLDGRYQIEVQRVVGDDSYRAHLVIFDRNFENELIHSEPVGLAYGAPFGPDVGDVADWQGRSIEVVDKKLMREMIDDA